MQRGTLCYLTFVLAALIDILGFQPGFVISLPMSSLLTGQVIDKKAKSPLKDVNIVVVNTIVGAATDRYGYYELRLLPGKYILKVTHIGYREWRQEVIIKNGGKERIIDFELEPLPIALPEVTLTEEKDDTGVSQFAIKERPLRNMASPLPDVLLTLKTLPGVSSLNDQSTLYNVRGGNFDENLIYINGIEIYQPQLVRKGIAENPSLINPSLLQGVNFRTGVFPVSYGDKLSSVLDLRYRLRFDRAFFAKSDVSAIGINAALGVRPLEKTWLQFAVRRISYGYLFNSLEVNGDYSPLFRDFQGIFNYQPHVKVDVTVLGLRASSKFRAAPQGLTLLNRRHESYTFEFGGNEKFDYSTNLLSLLVEYKPQTGLTLKWVSSWLNQREKEDTKLTTILYHSQPNEADDEAFRHEEIHNFLDSQFYTSRIALQWLVSPSLLINTGIELKHFTVQDSLFSAYKEDSGLDAIYWDPSKNYQRRPGSQGGLLFGRFIQSNVEISKRLALQLGLRWTKSSLNHEQLVMPRAQILYRLSNISRLFLAAGKYAQPPIYKEFQFREGEASGLLAQKAWQFTLGFERILADDLSLKLEAFYKNYSDLISYDLKDVQIRYSGKNDAVGYAYGLDAHLRGSILPNTENWISYSYLVTRENLLHDQEGYLPRSSDRRHQLAIYNEDKMERAPWSKLFVRFVFGTGYPFTASRWVLNTETNSYKLVEEVRNSDRLPFYARVDLGFTQEIKIGEHTRVSLREEILNLNNRRNTLGYDLAFSKRIRQNLSGRVFNFGVRADF